MITNVLQTATAIVGTGCAAMMFASISRGNYTMAAINGALLAANVVLFAIQANGRSTVADDSPMPAPTCDLMRLPKYASRETVISLCGQPLSKDVFSAMIDALVHFETWRYSTGTVEFTNGHIRSVSSGISYRFDHE